MSLGATLTLQQGVSGYAGAEDTFLVGDGVRDAVNWGARGDFYVGPFSGAPSADEVNRSLIRFDVSALAGLYAEITSVTLRLTIVSANGSNTVQLHQPTAANGDWVEGSADGTVQAGSSSWANKVEASAAWDGGPGLGNTGFGALLASAAYTSATTGVLELAILDATLATALIDDFLSGANEGFLLKALDESHPGVRNDIIFFSSEHGVVAGRPELVVSYTPVPEPGAVALLLATAAGLAVRPSSTRALAGGGPASSRARG